MIAVYLLIASVNIDRIDLQLHLFLLIFTTNLFLTLDDINQDKRIALRTAARKESMKGRQEMQDPEIILINSLVEINVYISEL